MTFKEENSYENAVFKRDPYMQQFCLSASIVKSFFFFFQGYSTCRPIVLIRLLQSTIHRFLLRNGIPVSLSALRRNGVHSSLRPCTFSTLKRRRILSWVIVSINRRFSPLQNPTLGDCQYVQTRSPLCSTRIRVAFIHSVTTFPKT